MSKPIHVIGLQPGELASVTALVGLLRHPDPAVAELCRQALNYLQDFAAKRGIAETPARRASAASMPSAG